MDALIHPPGKITPSPWPVVWALSVTEIISWGTLYYAISVLIAPIERELGWSRDSIVGAFSLSLLFAGVPSIARRPPCGSPPEGLHYG